MNKTKRASRHQAVFDHEVEAAIHGLHHGAKATGLTARFLIAQQLPDYRAQKHLLKKARAELRRLSAGWLRDCGLNKLRQCASSRPGPQRGTEDEVGISDMPGRPSRRRAARLQSCRGAFHFTSSVTPARH